MARKSTVRLARDLLSPAQFAAWKAMPVKLSASELRSGKRPGKRKAKATTKKKGTRRGNTLSAMAARDRAWDRHEARYGATDTRRAMQGNPPRNSRGQFVSNCGYKSNPHGFGELNAAQSRAVQKLSKGQQRAFWKRFGTRLKQYSSDEYSSGRSYPQRTAMAFKNSMRLVKKTGEGKKGGDTIAALRKSERKNRALKRKLRSKRNKRGRFAR